MSNKLKKIKNNINENEAVIKREQDAIMTSIINDIITENDITTKEDFEIFLNEVAKEMNEELKDNPNLEKAYELLLKAASAKDEETAKKFAKKAYETSNDCFDAILVQAVLEDSMLKAEKILDKGLKYEQKRLENKNYFTKKYIGNFGDNFETIPYINGLGDKAMILARCGKYHQSIDLCKEILRLDKKDTINIRYLLMAVYATLEDEKSMLRLYKKYKDESFMMLFSMFILYYKKEDEENAHMYLEKVNKANKNLIKYYKGKIDEEKFMGTDFYEEGSIEEILTYFESFDFLIVQLYSIKDYVLENSKNR